MKSAISIKSGEAPRGKPRGIFAEPCEAKDTILAKKGDKQPGFEKSLERLETIVREMESGELSLEKMMKHFEEGMSLVGVCSAKLNEVERKIELLVKQGDQTTLVPFETPEEPAEEEGKEAQDAAEKK